MKKKVILVKNLKKHFGRLKAVNGVNFEAREGEIVSFLGPNGAGKTTTLEMVEGLSKPTSGNIEVLGYNPVHKPNEVKKRIGIQLQSTSYYDHLNLAELLDLFASFFGRKANVKKLLDMVGLYDKRKSYVEQLSGGQKQRFAVVATLVNNPQIVFLDEPTTGLDPQARRNLWDVIRKIKDDGKTVILTTHYMEEAEVLADYVYIMDAGRVVAAGTPKELIKKLPNPFRIEITVKKCPGDEKIKGIKGVVSVRHEEIEGVGHKCIIGTKEVRTVLPNLISILKKQKIEFEDMEVVPANLEDVFLNLTGKELRD